MANAYAANPLAELMAERDPERYAAITRVSVPPKMFAGGTADVPSFTASGIDPQQLLKLPLGVRHAAAEETDISAVYAMFEHYAGIADAKVDSAGLQDAQLRIERWMRETDPRTPQEIAQQKAADDAWFEAYQRSLDRDGLLPEEREANRLAAWQAEQDAAEAKRAESDAEYRRRGLPAQEPVEQWAR